MASVRPSLHCLSTVAASGAPGANTTSPTVRWIPVLAGVTNVVRFVPVPSSTWVIFRVGLPRDVTAGTPNGPVISSAFDVLDADGGPADGSTGAGAADMLGM